MNSTNLPLLFVAGANELSVILQHCKEGFRPSSYANWNTYESASCRIVHTGVGAMNAVCAASAFLEYFDPPFCYQVGFSGAHRPEFKIADVILGREIKDFSRHTKNKAGSIEARPILMQHQDCEESFVSYVADSQFYQKTKELLEQHQLLFHEGIVGGADQFNKDIEFIKKIQKVYGTCCEDMESAAIAWAAHRWKIPHLSLRVISNNELSGNTSFTPECLEKLAILSKILIGKQPEKTGEL